jgi:hypothetical protein
MHVSCIESWRIHRNEESEEPMVEGSHAPNKRGRPANAAQRQQETTRYYGLKVVEGMLLNFIQKHSILKLP